MARGAPWLSTIGAKTAAAVAGVLLLVSLAVLFELTRREREHLISAKEKAASMVADLFAASVVAPLDFSDAEALAAEVHHLDANPEVQCVAVWGGTGSELRALSGEGGCERWRDGWRSEDRGVQRRPQELLLSRQIRSASGAVLGGLVVSFSLRQENAALEDAQRRLLMFAVGTAVVTAALLIFMSRRLVVLPLEKLSVAAKLVGAGNFGVRVQADRGDEIGDMARAFNAMGDALLDREQKLVAARRDLQELFDHMSQAVCAVGPDGRIVGPISASAKRIFSEEHVDGRPLREVLFPGKPAYDVDVLAFDEWLQAAFELRPEEWGNLRVLAPKAVALPRADEGPVELELDLEPIVRQGRVTRVLLMATDVTEKRRLEAAIEAQESRFAQRLAAIKRTLAGGGHNFALLIDNVRYRLGRCRDLLVGHGRVPTNADVHEAFRHVHTIRAEARTFGLDELESACIDCEDGLASRRAELWQNPQAGAEGYATQEEPWERLLARIADELELAIQRFIEASPTGRAALDRVTVSRGLLQELFEAAAVARGATLPQDVHHVIQRLASRPFEETTASLVDMVPSWGEQLGKRVCLHVRGEQVAIPAALHQVLGGIVSHLLRNAVAHGIEVPEVRETRGKSIIGVVGLEAVEGDQGPILRVFDDGNGVEHPAPFGAREASQAGESYVAESTLDGTMFFSQERRGPSHGNEFSGRGVGLAAVRSELETVGYKIRMTSRYQRFTLFEMVPQGLQWPTLVEDVVAAVDGREQ